MHVRARVENVRARPISHSRMHFREWSWKDGILIEHISYQKTNFSHIGGCMCTHEPKTCAHGLFLIVGCILEIGHGKTEYSLNIYLTTKQPISHSGMHFRDWSRKDEILIEHISNHIGACTCAQEPEICYTGMLN
jgi:hypothetical protein